MQRASSCRRRRGGEVELAAPAGPGEAVEILGAQDPRKRLDGKEEALPGRTPAVGVGRQATGGDQAVDMDVLSQVLAPGMQHPRHAAPQVCSTPGMQHPRYAAPG